jgi:di/tricarboxylate transporter
VAVLLFASRRLRVDVIGLLVMVSLGLGGVLTPSEALSGFSNPAVVTVWAVFILGGGLSRTGLASSVGRHVLRLVGVGEVRLAVVIMLTAGVTSALINTVGVVAVMLPVVMDVARRAGQPPSRLLMPLAFSALLGSMTTLIATPPNILVSGVMRDSGLLPFQMFDFTPVGATALLVGVGYMATAGRRLLPARDVAREGMTARGQARGRLFDLDRRVCALRLPTGSPLAGKTLAASRLGSALGANVIAIMRPGRTMLAPGPEDILRAGDRLLIASEPDRVAHLVGQRQLDVEDGRLDVEALVSSDVGVAELGLAPHSALVGWTVHQIDFRRRFGLNVLAVWRDGVARRTNLRDIPLRLDDVLLVQGPVERLEEIRQSPDLLLSGPGQGKVYRLHERLVALSVPEGSVLAGKTLAEGRLGQAFGLRVLGIVRQDDTILSPPPEERLQVGDTLLAEARPDDLAALRAFEGMQLEQEEVPGAQLESGQVALIEVVLSPRSTLGGRTLADLHFREKYGLSVLAIWREGKAHHTALRDMPLRLGDALLLHGPRERVKMLGDEPDFLVLTEEAQEAPRLERAPVAGLIMLAVVLPSVLGWVPMSLAAVAGAALMVVSGCLSMDEAYRAIEWRAVFLMAGMLPLGLAMQRTGAAALAASTIAATAGHYGPQATIGALFGVAVLATQVMPGPAVAVLMAPIALGAATSLHMSPYPLMMTVALSASASFTSPVSHPANLLIMGPGGYRAADYIRFGLPLTLSIMAVVVVLVPLVWPP